MTAPDTVDSDSERLVVLVHGLYMSGVYLRPLGLRLRGLGWRPQFFTYASVRGDPGANVKRLREFLLSLHAPTVQLVGHSLGGLLIRAVLSQDGMLPDGRVVTLGTPHSGSHVNRWLRAHRLGVAVGQAAALLENQLPPWDGRRELGSIAGNLGAGLGRLIPALPRPNDGTVAVAETRLAAMTDHICLPVSHTGLLLSAEVARQCDAFLRGGRFRRDAAKC